MTQENSNLPVEKPDLSHCLRPEFTAGVLDKLLDKRLSLNLTGERGWGKRRLLEDIRDAKPQNTKIVLIDLKGYSTTYSGLLREIHTQLMLTGDASNRLSQLFEGIEKERGHVLVMLANYDELLDNPKLDASYDKDFFDDLNFIKNKDNVSLLCTTRKPHNSSLVFLEGEAYDNSWLTVSDVIDLPELTRRQILNELERRLDEFNWLYLKTNYDDKEKIVEHVRTLPLPNTLLSFLVEKFNNQTEEENQQPFRKKFNRWLKAFKKRHKKNFSKRVYRARGEVVKLKNATGIKEVRIPVVGKLLNALIGWLKKQ